mmetsp:Transcript_1855/g.5800  ORF Transcript_1855/g.5800 Transcript_1855/m.5800 type:complete len:88 (+) Transcript_1855:285-548(+)
MHRYQSLRWAAKSNSNAPRAHSDTRLRLAAQDVARLPSSSRELVSLHDYHVHATLRVTIIKTLGARNPSLSHQPTSNPQLQSHYNFI